MIKKLKLLPFILLSVCLLVIPLCSRADFGDFSGDSDYSYDDDDDDDYSYSYDDDDDDDYSYSYDDDDDYSYDNNGYSYNNNNYNNNSHSYNYRRSYSRPSHRFTTLTSLMVLGRTAIILFIIMKVLKNHTKKYPTNNRSVPVRTVSQKLFPIENYQQLDPSFSPEKMKRHIADIYVDFQYSWQRKDLSDVRQYMTDAFYAQMDRQLDNYRQNHQTNCVEDITVTRTELLGWKREGENIVMIAHLSADIIDYVIDDTNGELVRGSSSKRKSMRYEWTLVRPDSTAQSSNAPHICPNCGAKLDMNYSSVCEYCGSHITAQGEDWAVSSIKGLSQQTHK